MSKFLNKLKKNIKFFILIIVTFVLLMPSVTSIPSATTPLPNKQIFTISGKGWGHGVGMCQWGANGQAKVGRDFKQILSYYYKNTSLSTIKNKALRIELMTGQSGIDISANGGFFVIDEKTKGKIGTELTGSAWTVTRGLDGSFLITRSDNSSGGSYAGPIRFEPIKKDGSTVFKLINSNHRYRGYLTIAPESGSLSKSRVINKIMMEDYLKGIAEIPYSWPVEALKAQVVAARSYASRRIGKLKDFDMYADDRDQVYAGYDQEIASGGTDWISAVTSTNGLVSTYRGHIINAYYFSTCGGSTENIENVWIKYSPYLRAVKCDYCQESPKYSWSERLSAEEIEKRLSSKRETTVKGKLAGLEVRERSGTSRVKLIRIIGTDGIVDTTGEKFRSALGLNSTLFSISKLTSPAISSAP